MTTPTDAAAHLAWRLVGASANEQAMLITDAIGDLARRLGADRSYVTLYQDDGTFQNLYEWTADTIVPQLPAIQRLQASDFAYTYNLALRGEVFAAPDLRQLPTSAVAEQRSFSSFGVAAVLQVPITVDGEGVGLIGLNHFDVIDGWSDEDVAAAADIGQAIGVALIHERSRDTTRRAAIEVTRSRQAKRQLLAHVSHELRTPLHGLLGYAELLELDVRSEADRTAVAQIEGSGRRLLAMIDDLIDIAEATASTGSDIAIAPIVAAAAEGLELVAHQRQVDISLGSHLQGVSISGERGRVRQVVYCAMSGAIQAIGPGCSLVVDAIPSAGPSEPATVVLHISSDAPMSRAELAIPLADTLMEDHGVIELIERPDGFDVRLAFEQHSRSEIDDS